MKLYVVISMIVVGAVRSYSAPFQNLGFDEANTNNLVDLSGTGRAAYGPINEMLPGWGLSSLAGEVTQIGCNISPLGLNVATLYDTNFLDFGFGPPVALKYALGLWPGPTDQGIDAPYHLSQTGDIPADAKTIHFIDFAGPFELRVDGQLLPLVYEYPPNYPPPRFNRQIPVPVEGDVSAFAGKTVELDFTTLSFLGPGDPFHGIDSISFSPESIPEPSIYALFALGGIGLFFSRSIGEKLRIKSARVRRVKNRQQ